MSHHSPPPPLSPAREEEGGPLRACSTAAGLHASPSGEAPTATLSGREPGPELLELVLQLVSVSEGFIQPTHSTCSRSGCASHASPPCRLPCSRIGGRKKIRRAHENVGRYIRRKPPHMENLSKAPTAPPPLPHHRRRVPSPASRAAEQPAE